MKGEDAGFRWRGHGPANVCGKGMSMVMQETVRACKSITLQFGTVLLDLHHAFCVFNNVFLAEGAPIIAIARPHVIVHGIAHAYT